MLRRVPVGAGQQQALVGMVGAGGPDLLAVDDPAAALKSARVVAPARSEPLPGSLNNWHQLSSPVRMRRRNFFFCGSVPCSSSVAAASISHSRFRRADRADVGEFLLDHAREADRQATPIPRLGPVRHAPTGVGELAPPSHQGHLGVPVGREPASHFGSDIGFANLASLFAHHSNFPTLHQEFPMVARLPEKDLGALSALEP